MTTLELKMIAACGLDCGGCDIYRVPDDPDAARKVTKWFKEMGWLEEGEGVPEVTEKAPYCLGCQGDRKTHWSPDCWILKCCADDRGLDHCHECEGFPCDELVEWAGQNDNYGQALERLKEIKKNTD